jgi:hypothetical protein
LTQPRIAVLSGRTLFAEGLAASLRRDLNEQAVRTIDAHQPELIEQLVAFEPRVVILDATDDDVNHRYPLDALLGALPGLTILRVDPQYQRLQVVTSQLRPIRSMSDIVGMITAFT